MAFDVLPDGLPDNFLHGALLQLGPSPQHLSLGIRQPQSHRHANMVSVLIPAHFRIGQLLSQAGLIRGRKIKQWVFYRRDENRIVQAKEMLSSGW